MIDVCCQNCGKEVEEDASFCRYCGYELVRGREEKIDENGKKEDLMSETKKISWKAMIAGALVALVLFFIIAMVGLLTIDFAFIIAVFLGGLIAGKMSPSGAWKHGLGATIIAEAMLLGFMLIELPRASIPMFIPWFGILIEAIYHSFVGLIGGHIGGKIKWN